MLDERTRQNRKMKNLTSFDLEFDLQGQMLFW